MSKKKSAKRTNAPPAPTSDDDDLDDDEEEDDDPKNPLCVCIVEAKPNKLFTEQQRAMIRFLIYSRKIPCAECGKLRTKMWTALYQFRAVTVHPNDFVLREPVTSHPPLTPVCDDHPLAVAWPKEEKEVAGKL